MARMKIAESWFTAPPRNTSQKRLHDIATPKDDQQKIPHCCVFVTWFAIKEVSRSIYVPCSQKYSFQKIR